ncbi:MAG: glutamate racemase [Pseudomonadota bacterium]
MTSTDLATLAVAPAFSSSPSSLGVFDSGVGGLSVLAALRRQMPGHPLLYMADSAHAPYGDRDTPHVLRRSQRIVEHLVGHGARLVVVACNTATALAIDQLRRDFPEVEFVGVEPGVKPAALASTTKRIAVMATPATLASPRYADLVARHAPGCDVHPVPCAGLAAAIEQGEAGRDEVERLLDRYCAPLNMLGADTVVLGCTHYPFVAERIASRLQPGIVLLDTADAVARRAATLLGQPAIPCARPAPLHLQTTGDPVLLTRMALVGLGQALTATRVDV